MADPRIVLIGYNGANNTGAEALLLSDLADVRSVFGPRAPITIPALEPRTSVDTLATHRASGSCPSHDLPPSPSGGS